MTLGDSRFPAEDRLQGWDYAAELLLDFEPEVDIEQLLEGTGLDSVTNIVIVGQVDCPATSKRVTASVPLESLASDPRISLTLPPGQFGDVLRLSRSIVLGASGTANSDNVAFEKGARLAESSANSLALEGDGGRFPTEAASFLSLGRDSAAWALDVAYEDLDEAFLGAVRLLVNTDHPAAAAALDPGQPISALVTSVLRHDVVRQLLTRIAMDPLVDVAPGQEFETDSIGAVAGNLCQVYLSRDLASVLQLLRADPSGFEMLLQARLNLLGAVK